MYKILLSLSVSFMLISTDISAQKTAIKQVEWTVAAKLQKPDGSASIGFAGPINAVHKDVLIVAGGANFPDKMPWEGGEKYYSKEIHILQKTGNHYSWNTTKSTLPEPIAYCGNTVTERGLVYAGGENEKGLSRKAYLLNWNAASNKVEIKNLPDLPLAVTNMALTHIGNTVYAVGGDEKSTSSNAFLSLNLDEKAPEWKRLSNLPIALANAVVITQKQSGTLKIYVIGGRTKNTSGISELHNTVYMYNPLNKTWATCADISDGKQTSNYSAGAGVPIGKNQILLLGGDNGETFHKIETYISQIAKSTNEAEKLKLTAEKNELSIHHKGFYKGMLLYNTDTNKWTKIGELPFPAQVTTTARMWGNKIVLSNGEIKPGVRTPNIMLGSIK
ncbi:kelch repeat-containing protein [Pedobacter frigoris]|uniref:Galactose oxidase n=1 Tax=Pedobacter frigoris TaxID=2571272 RepID=A0A4U1CPV7_9SPHI|nr:kelch repeat-containing protein [Pedobacter frigoris]TKC09533.1 galactose oxidase [Pedobacter frigoris]